MDEDELFGSMKQLHGKLIPGLKLHLLCVEKRFNYY